MARPCALLVGGELLSRITDMDDRSTCILFGDGAGAAVVKSTEGAPWHALLGTRGNREALWAAGPGNHPALSLIHIYFGQEGPGLQESVAMCDEGTLERYLERGQVEPEEIRALVEGRRLFPCWFGSALKLEGVAERGV